LFFRGYPKIASIAGLRLNTFRICRFQLGVRYVSVAIGYGNSRSAD